MSKEIGVLVVENGINTCYIDSLFMSMFYSPSCIYYSMLECDPLNPSFLYLQEMIKTNFVEPIRKHQSISAETINEIRNYMLVNGWKGDHPEEIFKQQDVNEFYTYLMNNFNSHFIELEKSIITEGLESSDDNKKIKEKIPFIPLSIPTNSEKELSIKDLLFNWFTDNQIEITRETFDNNNNKITSTVKGLATYKVTNIPQFIALSINRFSSLDSKRNYTPIDIRQGIRLKHSSEDLDSLRWSIHAAICHTGDTLLSGHYYALICHGNKWLIFDDKSVPSLSEIKISDTDTINKIKTECVFLIYKFDDFN